MHKIHTLVLCRVKCLGLLSNIDFFRNWAVPLVQLVRRILSLECLLRPWQDVGGDSLPVFWGGLGRQPSRCFTPRARCIDNPRNVLGPTAPRPNRYSLQTKLGITPYGDTLRSRGLLG